MAKKSKGKRQDQQQVSAVLMEQRRLTLKADMERWYRLRLEQFLSPDDARMAAYRTAGLATDLGTARRGKGTIGDWLAAHADRVIGGWRMITYPSIEVRTAALPHLREALDDERRLVAAIVRLHAQAPTLCMILLLVCFDSPWSEGDVARAFNDGSARSGWTRENVTKRKLKACLLIRAWTDPRPLPVREKVDVDKELPHAHAKAS